MSSAALKTLNDKYLRLWGIPLVALSGLLSLMQFFFQGRWDLFGKYLLASFVYTAVTWEICRWVLVKIRVLIPGLENTSKRLVTTMFYFFLVAGIGNAVVKAILYQFDLKPPSMADKSFFAWWLLNMPNILFFILLLSSIYEALYFFDQYGIVRQKAEQLKEEQTQKRLAAFKTRVNPHFLFNSLTTLSALISEDAPRAEHFVDELSKVYRYLLRAGRQQTATLGEELQFADSYAFLLKNRFEEGAFSLRKPDNLAASADQLVPVLSLQNTLDYLLRTQNIPLHIRTDVSDEQLLISCGHHPKTLSVVVPDTDWRQLENAGARQDVPAGQLIIRIPFISKSTSTP